MVAITEDTKDIGELYRKHYDLVCRAVSRVTRDEGLVEEIAHDLFSYLPEKLDQYGGRSSFRTWLYSVAKNHAIDYMKGERKHREAERFVDILGVICSRDVFGNYVEGYEELECGGDNPEEELAYKMRLRRLNEAIQRLEPYQRKVLELSLEGLEMKEIAKILGISERAAISTSYRARRSLTNLVFD